MADLNINIGDTMPESKRIHVSLVWRYERLALDWLVRRVPASVTPDMLTAFGTFGSAVTLVGYGLTWVSPAFLWLASFGLFIHWLGDSLDGNLARHRKIERPRYGYFLDQTVDVVGNLLIALGMAISPFVRAEVALFALAGYHMLSIYVFVRAYVSREFHVAVFNSGPTEIRLMIVAMNMLILVFGAASFDLLGMQVSWCDIAMSLLGLGFMVAFANLVFVYAKELRQADEDARAGF